MWYMVEQESVSCKEAASSLYFYYRNTMTSEYVDFIYP